MAGRAAPRPGGKRSVWFSGEQIEEMERRELKPGEVIRRGLLAGEPAEAPADMQPAMALIAQLAAALANGGRVVYPDDGGGVPGTVNTPEVMAAIAEGGDGDQRRRRQPPPG